jgi:hypothetical protein
MSSELLTPTSPVDRDVIARVKLHFAITWDSRHAHHTGTLCGRESSKTAETNCVESTDDVTCKSCLGILNNPNHWRHRKYV